MQYFAVLFTSNFKIYPFSTVLGQILSRARKFLRVTLNAS